jgi:K+-sensing histidine kinase KdpD
MAAMLSALSLWTFDAYAIWLPMGSSVFMISVSWIVFGFYRTALAEQRAALLTHERQSMLEFEELKNNFMSLISHDLKTPIAKIKAVAERLQNKNQRNSASNSSPTGLESCEELKALNAYTDELYRYIQTMLTLLRAETKAFKPRYESLDLNDIIKTAIERIEPIARAKSISLKAQLEPLFLLEADPTLMTEVILNLIDNAIKYSPNGTEVVIRSYERDDKVWVEVEDQGAGIPEDEMSKVFQKFTRGKDQAENSKGSGLGLYLVKYFIELHRGEVYLESRQGNGTIVRFFLPLGV